MTTPSAMSEPEVWAYIGRIRDLHPKHPIGKIVCVTVDKPEYAESNADVIVDWLRDGLTVERVPVTWARRYFQTTEPYVPETAP